MNSGLHRHNFSNVTPSYAGKKKVSYLMGLDIVSKILTT